MSARRARATPAAMQPTMRSPAPELGPRANRAIARILEATRAVFLSRGYAGTTIDEIARVAGMSRASFYTYFPTKRDVLLALGISATQKSDLLDHQLAELPRPLTAEVVGGWVDARFKMLDEHGGFSFAWTQAANEDEALRVAGMKQHLHSLRMLGTALGAEDRASAEALGLVLFSMIERSWSFCTLYGDRVDVADVKAEITRAILALANGK